MLEVTYKRHIVDDTQTHVHIAEDNVVRGDYQAAAAQLEGVIESRIQILRNSYPGVAD
jgi:hypothetical protein